MATTSKPDTNVRRGRSVVYDLHAHLVFVPKYRRAVFTAKLLDRCKEVMAAVCEDFEAQLVEFNGEADHVHLLVHYPPKVALSRLVNSLKGVSARRLRQEFPTQVTKHLWGDQLWSPSYFVASCGGAPLSIVADYIANQQRPV